MSGYTDSAIVDHGILEPGVTFVQKPFATERCSGRSASVLGRAPPNWQRSGEAA
jgi:hypothetical protein